MHIRIYVFGPGVGESIVLQYPKNLNEEYHWGLIDCHSPHVLDFLQNKHNVKNLEFVCWTHPHADHHNGMPALLEAYKDQINRFWRFGGHNAATLMTFYDRLTKHVPRCRSNYLTIKTIFDFALQQQKRNPDFYKTLTDVHHALINIKYNNKCHFKISSLSPSSRLAEEYTSHLAKCLRQMELDEKHFNFDWEAFDGSHNCVSAVLLVEFGKTRLLFGADAEQKVWSDILSSEERCNQQLALKSHFVKISHHGSENAYHKDTWEEIGRLAHPLAVLTPFIPRHLPTNEGIILLKKHCTKIYQTATRKNYQHYPTRSISIKLRRNWKTYKSDEEPCIFEFDYKGNLTRYLPSDTTVVFSDA